MSEIPEFENYDLTSIQLAEPSLGVQTGIGVLRVHPRSQCEGRGIPCCIHDPSGHHMRTWPMNWRGDTGVMERICPHGCGHPDPDHMAYVRSLTPEHECVRDWVRSQGKIPTTDPWARGSGWFYLSEDEDCQYPHLEGQGIHGCDGCC